MDKGNVRVLQGEASESDEEEIETSKLSHTVQYKSKGDGVVITEEAVQAESENNNQGKEIVKELDINKELTTGPVNKVHLAKPKYDSLLQIKLREKNVALRNHLKNAVKDTYVSATKDVQIVTQQLCKSQVAIQDASHCMRLVTNDLVPLQEKLDIVATCNILPNIDIVILK